MKSAFACLPLLAVTMTGASADRRSQGFAGSTPVGLGGAVAFSEWDCKGINADRRLSRLQVPLPDGCAVTIPSPDGKWIARTLSGGESNVLRVTGDLVVQGLEQPTVFMWQPDSRGFFLNGGQGSGQVSRMRYFYRAGAKWLESHRLADASSRLYIRRYDCRGGSNSYTNTSGWDWTHGLMRVIVQEGVHSKGCLQPHGDRNVLFEIIGNPVTGRITSAREITKLT